MITQLNANDIEETVLAMPTPGAVFICTDDNEFILVAINQPALDVFQVVRTDPTGRKMSQFGFSPNAPATLTGMANECIRTGTTRVFEAPFVLRDGSTLHASLTWVPILREGRVATLVLTVNDISELVSLRMRRAQELSLFASGFVQTCAWCGRVQDDGVWCSASDYIELHDAPSRTERCPDCR